MWVCLCFCLCFCVFVCLFVCVCVYGCVCEKQYVPLTSGSSRSLKTNSPILAGTSSWTSQSSCSSRTGLSRVTHRSLVSAWTLRPFGPRVTLGATNTSTTRKTSRSGWTLWSLSTRLSSSTNSSTFSLNNNICSLSLIEYDKFCMSNVH